MLQWGDKGFRTYKYKMTNKSRIQHTISTYCTIPFYIPYHILLGTQQYRFKQEENRPSHPVPKIKNHSSFSINAHSLGFKNYTLSLQTPTQTLCFPQVFPTLALQPGICSRLHWGRGEGYMAVAPSTPQPQDPALWQSRC